MTKDSNKSAEFYERLREQLANDTLWPSAYMYKFIVPAEEAKISQIKTIFKDLPADIELRKSSKGTFTSVSIKVVMASPDAVIDKYLEVSEVEGVISL